MDKYHYELEYQKKWAEVFSSKKEMYGKYLKEYRHLEEIKAICRIDDDTKILDVGCGISSMLHFLPGRKQGIDSLGYEYQKFYKYPEDIIVHQGFAEELPFSHHEFDVVLTTNAIDHVSNIGKAFDEIRRVLKTGGMFVLIVEYFPFPKTRDEGHPYSLTKNDIWKFLKDRDFKIWYQTENNMPSLEEYATHNIPHWQSEIQIISEKT